MILTLMFRYNPRHSRRDRFSWYIPNKHREIEKAQTGAGEEYCEVISSRVFSPGVAFS